MKPDATLAKSVNVMQCISKKDNENTAVEDNIGCLNLVTDMW